MDLILWRYAEAEYGPPDLERRLTDKGCKQAKQMAAWLNRHLPPNYQLWASQAERSRQTASYLREDYLSLSRLNPETDARTLPRLLESIHNDETVVIVGHQPWLGELTAFLFNGDWSDKQYWSYKKGGFWWLQIKATEEGGYNVKLKAALTPSVLAAR
ncbi:SixA phosphatase family protein [Neisseria sp. S1]|uniref:SixA phosphatase family protein n=1 Tax=Neisseria sp. S1 TaxID=3318354 RepID=UPI003A889BB6